MHRAAEVAPSFVDIPHCRRMLSQSRSCLKLREGPPEGKQSKLPTVLRAGGRDEAVDVGKGDGS